MRTVCPKYARCPRRDADHLRGFAHPLDIDYEACCIQCGVEYEPLSLKAVFDWTDADNSGKLSRDELEGALSNLSALAVSEREDQAAEEFHMDWTHLDEDGSGFINFHEFAIWAGPRLGLPLGLKHREGNKQDCPCSILGCPCESFVEGEWPFPNKCKYCKHFKDKHVAEEQTGDVMFPAFWDNRDDADGSRRFAVMVEMPSAGPEVDEFQQLLNRTYRNTWTRDRKRHHPGNPKVPTGFRVTAVKRNENSHAWRSYYCRQHELLTRADEGQGPEKVISDVKTLLAWDAIGGAKAERMNDTINEWYLFHGTSPAAAVNICRTDFKVGRAGENTGTLYGRGLYFAESITKADEYAKANDRGVYAVLICRVLGGNVLYTDEVTPDPEMLVYNCVQGPYDSVCGDREKCRGTYREFVLFDSEDVYVEYIVEYTRVY